MMNECLAVAILIFYRKKHRCDFVVFFSAHIKCVEIVTICVFWKNVCVCVCVSFFVHHKLLCCAKVMRLQSQCCTGILFTIGKFGTLVFVSIPSLYTCILWQHTKFNTKAHLHSQTKKNERKIFYCSVAYVCIAPKMIVSFFFFTCYLSLLFFLSGCLLLHDTIILTFYIFLYYMLYSDRLMCVAKSNQRNSSNWSFRFGNTCKCTRTHTHT